MAPSINHLFLAKQKLNYNFIWSYSNKFLKWSCSWNGFYVVEHFCKLCSCSINFIFWKVYEVYSFNIILTEIKHSCRGKIWSLVALPKLASFVNLLTVPPISSQGCFPWEVAKKTHIALIPNSEIYWRRLNRFFWFLYWLAQPSQKLSTVFCLKEVSKYFFENFILHLVDHCNIVFHVFWYYTVWKVLINTVLISHFVYNKWLLDVAWLVNFPSETTELHLVRQIHS